MKGGQIVDNLIDIKLSDGSVDKLYEIGVYRIKLQDIVVHFQECIAHIRFKGHRRVAQDADFRLRTIAVAQCDCIVNNARKVGVKRWFAIAGKGNNVGQAPFFDHLLQLFFQVGLHLLTRGAPTARMGRFIEATFAINAVERAEFSISRHQIDAQRNAQAPTMYGAKNRSWEKYS